MWKVIRGLYLGDGQDAYDRDLLMGAGITHIVNCAVEIPCWHRSDFRYLHLKLNDPDPNFYDQITRFTRFIHQGRRTGGVLVHCRAGLSRSPSVILAYLCTRGRSLDRAIEILSHAVDEYERVILPDASFLSQLELYLEEEGLDES